jgi:hypothetical protein
MSASATRSAAVMRGAVEHAMTSQAASTATTARNTAFGSRKDMFDLFGHRPESATGLHSIPTVGAATSSGNDAPPA